MKEGRFQKNGLSVKLPAQLIAEGVTDLGCRWEAGLGTMAMPKQRSYGDCLLKLGRAPCHEQSLLDIPDGCWGRVYQNCCRQRREKRMAE